MGYIANISGVLELKDKTITTKEELIAKIKSTTEWNEALGLLCTATIQKDQLNQGSLMNISYYDNYHEDEWRQFLIEIQEEIECGSELIARGEDGQQWRWIRRANGWNEQEGVIVYEKGFKLKRRINQ